MPVVHIVEGDARLTDSRTPVAHVLNGPLHTVSGLTIGHVLTALTATTFGFLATFTQAIHDAIVPGHHSNALDHSNILDHARLHSITGVLDHTFPGGLTFLRADGSFATPAAGAANIKATEQTFGASPVYSAEWTIVDAEVLLGSNIIVRLSAEPATGHDGDEAEMEPMEVLAKDIVAGQFTLYAEALDGPVEGSYVFNYLIG